jgi:undecaprenyl-diphosphatase
LNQKDEKDKKREENDKEVFKMSRTIEALIRWDQMFFWMVHDKIKCGLLDRIFPLITNLGSTEVTVFSAMVLFLADYSPGVPLAFNQGLQMAIGLGVSHAIIHRIKNLTGRARPYDALDSVHRFPITLKDYSFPSGHTAAAVTTALVIGSVVPALGWMFGALAALVGLSRVYLGVHYPTDVLAGALIGGATGLVLLMA